MSNNAGAHAFLLAASMASAVYAHADNADTANKSNNPLNLAPAPTIVTTPASATLTLDLKNDTHYIPLGLGGGNVWKSGSNILNAFVEPQWTVERKGDGLPQFTLYTGINVTFGK
jgi:hypothetical protein